MIKANTAFFFLLTLYFSLSLKSQNKFTFSGAVAENDVVALEDVSVVVFESFEKVMEFTTTSKGRFTFSLDMNKDYTIEFSKSLYVTKKISVSTEPPPDCKKHAAEYDMKKISLFKFVEGINYKMFKKPILYYQFSEKCKFGKDEQFAAVTDAMMKKLETDITNQQKEIAKLSSKEVEKKKEEAKVVYEQYKTEVKQEEEKEKFKALPADEKFAELIKKADENWNKNDYEAAKKKYEEALRLKPGNLYAETQLMRMDGLITQEKKQKQSDETAMKKQDDEDKNAEKKEGIKSGESNTLTDELKKSEKKNEALLLKISDDVAAKAFNALLEKQREIERINDMKSIMAHAKAKRIFLEEIADSKMKLKMESAKKF